MSNFSFSFIFGNFTRFRTRFPIIVTTTVMVHRRRAVHHFLFTPTEIFMTHNLGNGGITNPTHCPKNQLATLYQNHSNYCYCNRRRAVHHFLITPTEIFMIDTQYGECGYYKPCTLSQKINWPHCTKNIPIMVTTTVQ